MTRRLDVADAAAAAADGEATNEEVLDVFVLLPSFCNVLAAAAAAVRSEREREDSIQPNHDRCRDMAAQRRWTTDQGCPSMDGWICADCRAPLPPPPRPAGNIDVAMPGSSLGPRAVRPSVRPADRPTHPGSRPALSVQPFRRPRCAPASPRPPSRPSSPSVDARHNLIQGLRIKRTTMFRAAKVRDSCHGNRGGISG